LGVGINLIAGEIPRLRRYDTVSTALEKSKLRRRFQSARPAFRVLMHNQQLDHGRRLARCIHKFGNSTLTMQVRAAG
jgi:hypothetical protein